MPRRRLRKRGDNVTPKRPGSWLDTGVRAAKVAKHAYDVGTHSIKRIKSWKNAYTQTEKKKGTSNHIKGVVAGECTRSFVHIKQRPSKMASVHRALSSKFSYEAMVVGQLLHGDDVNTPRQQSKTVGTLWSGADYGAAVNSAYLNLPDANPFQGAYPGSVASGNQVKVLAEKAYGEWEFANMTVGMIMVQIYTLVAKTTGTYEDPWTTWTNAFAGEAGTSYTTTGTRNFPGNKPTQYKPFRDKWKVVNHTSLSMMPGSMHRHKVVNNPNRITDYAAWQTDDMQKGLTTAVLIIGRGQIVDNTLGMKGTQVVTFHPIKIDYTHKVLYTTRVLSTLPNNHYYNNVVGTTTYDEDVTTDHGYLVTGDHAVVDTHDINTIA